MKRRKRRGPVGGARVSVRYNVRIGERGFRSAAFTPLQRLNGRKRWGMSDGSAGSPLERQSEISSPTTTFVFLNENDRTNDDLKMKSGARLDSILARRTTQFQGAYSEQSETHQSQR